MQKVLPAKTLKIEIRGNSYDIKLPNTGEFIDIQGIKSRIANENYGAISNSLEYQSGFAKLLVDMIATFNVLIPELKNSLNTKSILALSMQESRELLDPYMDVFLPWYDEWMDIFSAKKTKEEEKPKDDVVNKAESDATDK